VSDDDEDAARIRELVERSSFGTPEAVALRASVSGEQVRRVLARRRELDEADASGSEGVW
jgi:hypothetical protein